MSNSNDPMKTSGLCCKNVIPANYTTPFYTTKYASNITNEQYGNIQTITSSTMRKNYAERIKYIMNDNSNEVGLSAGGGEYVIPNYKHRYDQFHKHNCFDFGYQKLRNAYGNGNNGQCKIHYEDY